MKLLGSVALVAVCALVFADNAFGRGVSEKKNIVPVAGTSSGGGHGRHGRCWHRSGGGRAAASSVPSVRTSSVEQSAQSNHPDNVRPDVINGIDWYLNGRGYYSD